MANGHELLETKRIRMEVLVMLRLVYPASLQADSLMRSLLVLFPTLEVERLKRDLHYFVEKGYVERVQQDGEENGGFTPWRRRWFRLTATGMEIAERGILDPAIQE